MIDNEKSAKRKQLEAGMKRLLTVHKEAKRFTVMNSQDTPSETIVLMLRRRGMPKPGEDDNSLVAWMELDEKGVNKLIHDLTLRLRYMKRKEIEQ